MSITPPRDQSAAELALRRSLEMLNITIQQLCKQRDLLAAQLPAAPRRRMPATLDGVQVRKTKPRRTTK
jgi:hypothetical protein